MGVRDDVAGPSCALSSSAPAAAARWRCLRWYHYNGQRRQAMHACCRGCAATGVVLTRLPWFLSSAIPLNAPFLFPGTVNQKYQQLHRRGRRIGDRLSPAYSCTSTSIQTRGKDVPYPRQTSRRVRSTSPKGTAKAVHRVVLVVHSMYCKFWACLLTKGEMHSARLATLVVVATLLYSTLAVSVHGLYIDPFSR